MPSKRLFPALLCVALSFLALPARAAKDMELLAAIQKLREAGSYTWHTELRITPGVAAPVMIDGSYNSSQGLYVKVTAEKHSVELAARSGVVVARSDGEWRVVKKFSRSDLDHTMIRGLADMKLPHIDLAEIQSSWRSGRSKTAGLFEGQVGLNAARKLAGLLLQQAGTRLGGLSVDTSNASITLSGGLPELVTMSSRFSGSQGPLAGMQNVQVVQTTQFTKVGATEVQIPREAEALILATLIR